MSRREFFDGDEERTPSKRFQTASKTQAFAAAFMSGEKDRDDIVPKDVDVNSSTFYSLHVWFKNLFEHYGWMLLAQARGDHYKIAGFVQGVKKLVVHIATKYASTHDPDRREDLAILYKHARILEEDVETKFGM